MDREILVARKLMKTAKAILAGYEYLHDPDHKKRPEGGGWEKTKSGWSRGKATSPQKEEPLKARLHKMMTGDYRALQGHVASKESHRIADETLARYRATTTQSISSVYTKKYVGVSPERYTQLKHASFPKDGDSDARSIYEGIVEREPEITRLIQSTPNVTMRERDMLYRVKEGDSFNRKFTALTADYPSDSPEEIASRIGDAIRYTVISEPEHLVDGFNSITDSLKKKGYTLTHCQNMFVNAACPLNCVEAIYSNERGEPFEIMYHTPSTKENMSHAHAYYEAVRFRGFEKSPEEMDAMLDVMYEDFNKGRYPDRIEEIADYSAPGDRMVRIARRRLSQETKR